MKLNIFYCHCHCHYHYHSHFKKKINNCFNYNHHNNCFNHNKNDSIV